MISEAMKKELKAEFDSMNLITVEDIEEDFIQGIKLSGYRLSREEKETIAFQAVNFDLDVADENAVADVVEFERKCQREFVAEQKAIKQFEKTLGRLSDEDLTGYVHGSDYYTYETIVEGIEYMGAVKYAKFWFRTRF